MEQYISQEDVWHCLRRGHSKRVENTDRKQIIKSQNDYGSRTGFNPEKRIYGITAMERIAFIWLSFRALKWIYSAFEDTLKVMGKYTLLTNIVSLPHEAGLVAPRTYVQ